MNVKDLKMGDKIRIAKFGKNRKSSPWSGQKTPDGVTITTSIISTSNEGF